MTNDIPSRILEHGLNEGHPKTFVGHYHCYLLVHYEEYRYVHDVSEERNKLKSGEEKKRPR